MATYPSMFLLALLFVAATILALGDAQEITFVGRVSCAEPRPGFPTIAGFNVGLACDGDRTGVGQALTDADGIFRVGVKAADGLLFDEKICYITVRLPDYRCRVYLPNGILQEPEKVVVIAESALGDRFESFPARLFKTSP